MAAASLATTDRTVAQVNMRHDKSAASASCGAPAVCGTMDLYDDMHIWEKTTWDV